MLNYNDYLRQVFSLSIGDEVILETLEILHNGSSLYIVRNNEDMSLPLELGEDPVDFLPIGCEFALPPLTGDDIPEFNVTIDNTNLVVSSFFQNALLSPLIPIVLNYRIYVSGDVSEPQTDPPLTFSVDSSVISFNNVSIVATLPNPKNKAFLRESYTYEKFPYL